MMMMIMNDDSDDVFFNDSVYKNLCCLCYVQLFMLACFVTLFRTLSLMAMMRLEYNSCDTVTRAVYCTVISN